MKSPAEATRSIWMVNTDMPDVPALKTDTHADICVVGAGIAGLTTAYLLTRAGRSVVVIDSGFLGGGQTARTSAHLTYANDDRYFELERIFGVEGSRLAAQSHSAAVDFVERTAATEHIACDFRRTDGYLILAAEDKAETLEKELEAAHRAGLASVEKLARTPYPSFDSGPCLRFPNQAQFQPLKYLAGLVAAIQHNAGRLYSLTRAITFEGGEPARVKVHTGAVITCNHTVVATDTPVNDRMAIHTKQAAYRTYVVGAPIPLGSVPKILCWDTGDPYHYIRVVTLPDETGPVEGGRVQDVLIVGGEDHKTGQASDMQIRYSRLERWARERFPMMGELQYWWSGQIMETMDGLGFIGRNPGDGENVFIATGDSGHGLTHGTIAGMLISDLILGRPNPWEKLYDPSRKKLAAIKTYVEENANVVGEYTQWLKGSDMDSAAKIKPGEGAVIAHGATKVAAYRDPQGTLHELNAKCTHLNCVVGWNPGEKTWDCPCHGSRFSALGEVINGPANRNLAPVTSESVEVEVEEPHQK